MSVENLLRPDMGSDDVVLTLLDNMIWPILALTLVGVMVLVPQTFRNLRSVELLLHGSVGLGFLVLAESICLISGHFDLSIGSIAGFSAMLTALMLSPSKWAVFSDPILGFVVILAVGTVIGSTNGIMISKFGINPFLQTLAFLIIFEGLKISLSSLPVSDLPEGYTMVGSTPEYAIGLLLVTFAVAAVLMSQTNIGQSIYALGSEKESARAVGINTDRMIIAVYGLSGLLSAMGGLMLTGFTTTVSPETASGMVFPAFAAAVIGGISLFGGRGKVSGALGGVLLLSVIQSALNLSGVGIAQIQAVNGAVLLVAILLYNTRSNIRQRVLAAEVSQ
ncbi:MULTISPECIES: ABC transporter permease [Haloarcula]|uniref:ABC transporter permease n=1 Tax=Haloarcula TaxID=2237 RepID=UPI0023EC2371|nr:ABC transporter permease [Halomicroarcula sp. XH51]